MGACNITLIAILGIFETYEKKVLAEKKVLVSDERRVGSLAVDADLQLTNARPYDVDSIGDSRFPALQGSV